MHKPVMVLKVAPKKFSDVRDLALTVYDNMNLNPNFIHTLPSLNSIKSDTAALTQMLAKCGDVGNRGAHKKHVDLENKSGLLHARLMQPGFWCMSSFNAALAYEDQTVILYSSGFPLKNARAPQGRFEMVQDFNRVISRQLRGDQVKLAWKKPVGVMTRTDVRNYNVYRNTTNDFSTASIIASLPQTTYIDEPGTGTSFYWVVASINKGNGVTSHLVIAKIA